MSTHRQSFARLFGEDQAAAIERAADSHRNNVHDRLGSDPFRWALLICIGSECMQKPSYRAEHDITAPWDDINAWMLLPEQRAWFREHDGDVDFIALFCGVYNVYVEQEQVQ